jgi:hypothetical protein
MKRFLGYFDLLGYKEFVRNNTDEEMSVTAGYILRDLELALSRNKITRNSDNSQIIADLTKSTLICFNVSDTIFLITRDDSSGSVHELIEVAYYLNNHAAFRTMPLRGAIVYGELNFRTAWSENTEGGIYSPNLMYGRALIAAHEKAENLQWSGTVIDDSFIEKISGDTELQKILTEFAKLHKIPYKNPEIDVEEWALKLVKYPINDESFRNLSKNIIRSFSKDNKPIDSDSVQTKINNTISFLQTHIGNGE